jgi:tetratricopeptide (TPR) repeat protein
MALAEQRELAAARADVDSVLADEPDARTTARARTVLAHLDQMAGDSAGAIEHAEAALAASRAVGDEQGAADALRARGVTFMFDGNLDAADRDFTDALQAFRECGDRRGEAWALQNLASIAFFRSDSDTADKRLERSAAVFRELGDYGGLNWCEGVRAWVRFTQGRLDEAEALAVEQLPETDATGNRWVGAILTLLLTNLALWRGESQRAVVHAEETLARFQAIADPWGVSQAQGSVVRALICLGRVGDALDLLDAPTRDNRGPLGRLLRAQVLAHLGSPEALPAALHVGGLDEGSNRELGAAVHLVLGLALLQAGRVDEAVAEIEIVRLDRGTPGAGFSVAVSAGLALAYVAAGRSQDARALADAAVGAGTYLDQLQHGLAGAFAALQIGAADAPDRFDAVVAASDATESRLDQAVTRLARGQAWRALGRDDADAADDDARGRLATMGIDGSGWVRLFSVAAGT